MERTASLLRTSSLILRMTSCGITLTCGHEDFCRRLFVKSLKALIGNRWCLSATQLWNKKPLSLVMQYDRVACQQQCLMEPQFDTVGGLSDQDSPGSTTSPGGVASEWLN